MRYISAWFLVFSLAMTGMALGKKPQPPAGPKARPAATAPVQVQIEWLKSSANIVQDAMILLEAGLTEPVKTLLAQLLSDPERHAEGASLASLMKLFEGDYASSLDILSASHSLPGSAKSLKTYVAPLVDLTSDFVSFESDHFVFRTKSKDSFLHYYALPALEEAYAKINAEFGDKKAPDYSFRKIIVEVYPDKESFSSASTLSQETLERSGAIGICKFGRLMIISPSALPHGYRWLDTICHEYMHKLINQISGYSCPLWLHEGLANYYGIRWRIAGGIASPLTPSGETALAEAWKAGKLISFSRMEPSLVNLESQEQVNLAFAEVGDAAAFMRTTYGQEKVAGLLAAFKFSGRDDAFKSVLGVNQSGFEELWKKSLEAKHFVSAKGAIPDITWYRQNSEIDEFVDVGIQGHVKLGDQLLNQGETLAALVQYNKSLKEAADNPVVLSRMGKCYILLKDNTSAEEKLKHAVVMNPNYVTSYFLLGELYYNEGKYNEALDALEEANAINPFNPEIHKITGKIYTDVGPVELAHREVGIAVELDPEDEEAQTYYKALGKTLSDKH